jgi:L-threonylcarbamoyladenylate synthase
VTVVRVASERPDAAVIAYGAALLRAGGLVAFPTETVYGLGANALDPVAVERIYLAKGRPAYNPLIVHVADEQAARSLTSVWPDSATILARRYWPGPLTLVLPRAPSIADGVTAGLATVAVRVPAHPVALALIRAADLPVAAPSANRSGAVSPTTAAHVAHGLGDRVPLILDAGPATVGIESTVVDLSGGTPVVLRPGMIGRDELAALIGPVGQPTRADPGAPRPSPGMLDRHYAPRARLIPFTSLDEPAVVAALESCRHGGGRPAALLRGAAPDEISLCVTLAGDPAAYARGLYQALHRLDEAGATLILVERPPAGIGWEGVRNRLDRAAAGPP